MGGLISKVSKPKHKKKNSVYHEKSSIVFYKDLMKELNEEELYCLQYLFYTIRVSEHQIGKSFFKFMIAEGFASMYEDEIYRLKKKGILKDGDLSVSLLSHCFAAIGTHLAIIKNIQNAAYVHEQLKDVAIRHCLLKHINSAFTFHDGLLYKFIKKEFDKYHNPFTLKALQKYFRITRDRLIFLTTEKHKSYKSTTVIEEIQKSRNLYREKAEEINNLQLVFSGVRVNQSLSELSLMPSGSVNNYNKRKTTDDEEDSD